MPGRLTGLLLTALVLAASCAGEAAGGDDLTVVSPDGRTGIALSLPNGRPHYAVSYRGDAVVRSSPMGFRFRGDEPMDAGFTVVEAVHTGIDETWEPVWGPVERITNRCNELLVKFREERPPSRELRVVLRAYDDGVAFRYVLPAQPNLRRFEITSEETRFLFAGDHTAWWIPADYDSYEHLYRTTRLSEIVAVNTPITMRTSDGLYISVNEANLTDYAGMTLEAVPGESHAFRCELVPWPDGTKVKGETPHATPWRTIQIAKRPGDLIESHLIVNLNEPCVIEDTSWITPMKYVGIWWSLHIGKETWHTGPTHGATTENAKRYIDFASRHGIPGLLIEGWNTGWNRWGQEGAYDFVTPYDDFDIHEVARYAFANGVALIGHHETGGDVPTYERQIDAAFGLYTKLGISAVKTGYAGRIFPRGQHHHGQWMVNHYRSVVEKAAASRIMIDVHEPIKPTGIRRTYPNMMTREGVRGTEYNAWSEGNPPEHVTILPFTRMLAGPLDYTPGIFDLTFNAYKPENRVRSTLANQLAIFVVLESPLQMAADLPENYEGHPAFEFIEVVPCDWDDTRVIDGEIGDFVTIARRRGSEWFIGSVTDEEARELEIPLSFLPEGEHVARVYADADDAHWETNPTAFAISDTVVDRDQSLTARLAPGGGHAVWLRPVAEAEPPTSMEGP